MHNKFETIGIVDWYEKEKGYGVLKNIHDQREYFIHQSKLDSQYKQLLAEGDIVIFSPNFDQKRDREIATNLHYLNKTHHVQWAINQWIQEDYLIDEYLEKILIGYLKDYDKDENASFKDAYNHLIEIIWPFLGIDGISGKLFSILKKAIASAFDQKKSSELLELTYLVIMEKLPSDSYFLLLDSKTPPYIYFVFALNASDYTSEAIHKAIEYSKDTCCLLDDLIRFTKDVNEQDIKDSLDRDKSLITNIDFISNIVGDTILSEIYRHIYTSCDSTKLKNLVKKGYIHNIDNPVLKHNNPDCYKAMMIYGYKEELIAQVDLEFIKENISEFTASDLIRIKHYCQLTNNDASELYRCLVKYAIVSEQERLFKEVLYLASEIEDLHKWIKDNHSYLTEDADAAYQEFMIWLYKNSQIKDIDEAFVKYYIDRFNTDDIFRLLNGEHIELRVKESILTALFTLKIGNSSPNRINEISQLCNRAEELLNEHYSAWFTELCTNLADVDKYVLWKNKVSDIYPSNYIREKLLGSEEQGYKEYYELYQRQLMPAVTACNELWSVLTENETVGNRPTFYKILYCIKYLVLINSSYKEAIEQKGNDYYLLILWFLSYSESFDFELLRRLFIYFLPLDQVRIIKTLFYMTEVGKIQLSIKFLDSLLRVDADLYRLISAQHPEVPIDVSSEIVIKSLVNISEKGNFSTDKDVLTIVIQAAQYNKNENFKIGSYFDECVGRKIYKWDGNRRVNGCIKQINDSWFCVTIFPYVEERVYSRGMGYHTESVWNSSFHEAVDAVKNITGRRWNTEKSYWEVPLDEKERLYEIAVEYGFEIEGTKNPHMKKFKVENEGRPARVNYCEGRPAQKFDDYVGKEFLWCRNSKCFSECVKEHSKEDWGNYTLLDFCRILGIETDSVDSEGRTIKYGKYLSFSSIINRANSIIEHLYCRECGEMLEPVQVSNYYTHLVTHFHCTNASCGKCHEKIYISKCFNWKCNGVIDDRDTQKCPNGWNICPECGSCCSNRIAQQRIDNCKEVGIRPNPYFIDFINNTRGHLEKRLFYCWKCGKLTTQVGDSIFECPNCGVKYERRKYDFEPRYTSKTS